MGYYVRALCTSEVVPTLGEVQAWLKQNGSAAEISDADLESSVWEGARPFYRRGKLPILVECRKQTVVAHIAATGRWRRLLPR